MPGELELQRGDVPADAPRCRTRLPIPCLPNLPSASLSWADDAVGCEPDPALEALDRRPRRRPVHPVDRPAVVPFAASAVWRAATRALPWPQAGPARSSATAAAITTRTAMALVVRRRDRPPLAMVRYAVHNECLWIRGSLPPSSRWSRRRASRKLPNGWASPSPRSACRSVRSRTGSAGVCSTARAARRADRGRASSSTARAADAPDRAPARRGAGAARRPASCTARSRSAPRPGPAGMLVPLLLCEFQRDHPELAVSLYHLGHATG